jgi:hypothetical protein
MKIKNISLSNFAKYDQVDVSFDDNVTYLVGKNGSGKSTLGITAIWFLFQGIAEKATDGKNPLIGERFRFIGPKGASAKGEMILMDEKTNVEIKVTRKLTKTGTEVSFEGPEGMNLDQKWLTDLFNVFLIAPKMFCDLSPKEQAKALGIDTKRYDEAIAKLKTEFTAHNAVYRSYGELREVEKIEKVLIEDLQAEKTKIREQLGVIYRANQAKNRATRETWEDSKRKVDQEVDEFNFSLDKTIKARNELTELRDRLEDFKFRFEDFEGLVDFSRLRDQIGQWVKETPTPRKIAAELYPKEPTNLSDMPEDYTPAEGELVYVKEIPSQERMEAIDKRISDAAETNQKALLYDQYIEKKKLKDEKKQDLDANQTAQRAKENERVEYIKKFKFPFSNISVGEDGELLLAGKPIKEPYFSTGEILKVVPILISTRNPELKYVFLQDFNLMDDDKQKEIEQFLTGKGFQLVVEMVGKQKITDKNCILLKDNIIVEDYAENAQPQLAL